MFRILWVLNCVFCFLLVTSDVNAQTYRGGYRVVSGRSYASRQTNRPTYPSRSYRAPMTTRSSFHSNSATRRRKAPYRLDGGDTLAIMVHGILGEFGKAPVHMPRGGDRDILPCVGMPVPVLSDGTVALPSIPNVSVRGLTVVEAEKKISNVYLAKKILSKPHAVTVNLLRKRTIGVMVFQSGSSSRDSRNSGAVVRLQPGESHVLGALAKTGSFDSGGTLHVYKGNSQTTRANVSSSLKDGDVVHVKSPVENVFYAMGALRGGQYEIPRGRALNVREAVAVAGGGGPVGYYGPSEVVIIRSTGTFRVSLQGRGANMRIQPGDTIVLRHSAHEVAGNVAAQAIITGGVLFAR